MKIEDVKEELGMFNKEIFKKINKEVAKMTVIQVIIITIIVPSLLILQKWLFGV